MSLSSVRLLEVVYALVCSGNDYADGFLVETFEAAVALEIFQVAAQRAFVQELIKLVAGDQTGGEKPLGAFAADGPALAFGEGLAQEIEIGERLHGIDAAVLQLSAQEIEIEPGFEMVHA